jgi:hypothetical protein
MLDKDPTTVSWLHYLIPSGLTALVTFIVTMLGFKSSSNEKDRTHERDIISLKNNIEKLEKDKVDKESINNLREELRRLDNDKAGKEVVAMLITQLQSIDTKVSTILNRLPE